MVIKPTNATANDNATIKNLIISDNLHENEKYPDTMLSINQFIAREDVLEYKNIVFDYYDSERIGNKRINDILNNGTTIYVSVNNVDDANNFINKYVHSEMQINTNGTEIIGMYVRRNDSKIDYGIIKEMAFSVLPAENHSPIRTSIETDENDNVLNRFLRRLEDVNKQLCMQDQQRISSSRAIVNYFTSFNNIVYCTYNSNDVGVLSIVQYVVRGPRYINSSTGKTEQIDDVVSMINASGLSEYFVKEYTGAIGISTNSHVESILTQTTLPSDTLNVNLSLSGGIPTSGITLISGSTNFTTSYTTSTYQMSLSNQFANSFKKCWDVEPTVYDCFTYFNIYPGVRVKNTDNGTNGYAMAAYTEISSIRFGYIVGTLFPVFITPSTGASLFLEGIW